jgi:hypothetical protein
MGVGNGGGIESTTLRVPTQRYRRKGTILIPGPPLPSAAPLPAPKSSKIIVKIIVRL